MSRDIAYVDATVVPSYFLNETQEVMTGLVVGTRIDLQTSNTVIRLTGDPLTDSQYGMRVGAKPRYGTVAVTVTGAGGAGTRDVFATTPSGVDNASTVVAVNLNVQTTGATPGGVVYRKIGEATWSGTAFTDLRLTHGVQANADQYNSFIFRPIVNSATPLIVRGLASQTADIFRVENSSATSLFSINSAGSVSSSSITLTGQAIGAGAGVGIVSAPSYAFTGDLTTGLYSPSVGTAAMAAAGTQIATWSATGVTLVGSAVGVPLTLGADVALYRGAANRLDVGTGDSLNLVSGSLLFGGTALAVTHLSDAATVARTTGTAFSGAVSVLAGTVNAPGVAFATEATTGLYAPANGQVALTAAGVQGLNVDTGGTVTVVNANAGQGLLLSSSGPRLFSNTNVPVNSTNATYMCVLAGSLEVRRSDAASNLILSRPDGTRISISVDNTNTLVIAPA